MAEQNCSPLSWCLIDCYGAPRVLVNQSIRHLLFCCSSFFGSWIQPQLFFFAWFPESSVAGKQEPFRGERMMLRPLGMHSNWLCGFVLFV